MTGRRLYDALTDAWATNESWNRTSGNLMRQEPLAWPFLSVGERRSLNKAAAALTPTKSSRSRG